MFDETKERCEILAKYICDTKCTVRKAGWVFGISKSTVHKDITERLRKINPALGREVNIILQRHKEERHIRGGNATREKYRKIKENENEKKGKNTPQTV